MNVMAREQDNAPHTSKFFPYTHMTTELVVMVLSYMRGGKLGKKITVPNATYWRRYWQKWRTTMNTDGLRLTTAQQSWLTTPANSVVLCFWRQSMPQHVIEQLTFGPARELLTVDLDGRDVLVLNPHDGGHGSERAG
ncbi:hypothetical protein [Serratia fonticola]